MGARANIQKQNRQLKRSRYACHGVHIWILLALFAMVLRVWIWVPRAGSGAGTFDECICSCIDTLHLVVMIRFRASAVRTVDV